VTQQLSSASKFYEKIGSGNEQRHRTFAFESTFHALFSVSLLFSLEVEARNAPEPLRELAIHVVSAADEGEAKVRGEAIGRSRQTSYNNRNGEPVRDVFMRVVEVQALIDDHLFEGMEVASWMFWKGERLIFDDAEGVPKIRRGLFPSHGS
jgi:hypothetical protein